MRQDYNIQINLKVIEEKKYGLSKIIFLNILKLTIFLFLALSTLQQVGHKGLNSLIVQLKLFLK